MNEPVSGDVAESVEVANGYILLLNVVQSAAERTPAELPEDVAEEITGVALPVDERG